MNIILERLKLFKYIVSLEYHRRGSDLTDIIREKFDEFREIIYRNKDDRLGKPYLPIFHYSPFIYISDKYKFIWHVMPKSGTTSILKIIATLCDDDAENILKDSPYCVPVRVFWRRSLKKAPEKYKPKYAYQSYYHFAFVRNPWARLVSLYFNKINTLEDKRYYKKIMQRRYKIKNSKLMQFEDFVKFVGSVPDGYCETHFLPYHYQINLQDVDYLGKLETFEDDMHHILNTIAPDQHIEIPELNSSMYEKKSYRNYYTDETRDIVSRKYAKDIELFDYQF